jgi:pyridoxine 5'-phosphate synthase PdxJ
MSSPITPSAILTDAHYQNLVNALDQAARIQNEINLAQQAGLDVTAAQDLLNTSVSKIRQVKAVYFPGRA